MGKNDVYKLIIAFLLGIIFMLIVGADYDGFEVGRFQVGGGSQSWLLDTKTGYAKRVMPQMVIVPFTTYDPKLDYSSEFNKE